MDLAWLTLRDPLSFLTFHVEVKDDQNLRKIAMAKITANLIKLTTHLI